MRLSLLTVVLGLVVSAPAFAAVPERVPVVHVDRDHVYVAWSAEDGAREGMRAALVGPDSIAVDTLTVVWTRDAITALARASARALDDTWLARPLEAALARAPQGTLSVPLFADPATLDPVQVTSLAEKQIVTQIYEGLVRYDAHLQPIAAAADSFRQEGRVWTFHLRPGARFHDGRAVRAADFVATLTRALAADTRAPRVDGLADAIAGAAAFRAGKAKTITGIAARDSLTLAITVTRERAPLLAELASPAAFVVPASGPTFMPIGSGPFRFVRMNAEGVLLRAAESRARIDSLVFRRVDGPDVAALH
jgi:ABC-type transport system substrate-binding protein